LLAIPVFQDFLGNQIGGYTNIRENEKASEIEKAKP
jgi:hypothetical protein